MQELLLFGHVPSDRHDYVLSVLAGIAAMQPIPILEKHLNFKPSRPLAAANTARGASSAIAARQQQGVQTFQAAPPPTTPPGDLFYLKVIIDLTRSVAGTGAGAGTAKIAMENRNGWTSSNTSSNKDGVRPPLIFPLIFQNPCFFNNI